MNDLSPGDDGLGALAALSGRAQALESAHAAETAPPQPPPLAVSPEHRAIARLALHTLGLMAANGFQSEHWVFSNAELDALEGPWAAIVALYFPVMDASPWLNAALVTVPLLAGRLVQQRQIDEARGANPVRRADAVSDADVVSADEYGPGSGGDRF